MTRGKRAWGFFVRRASDAAILTGVGGVGYALYQVHPAIAHAFAGVCLVGWGVLLWGYARDLQAQAEAERGPIVRRAATGGDS